MNLIMKKNYLKILNNLKNKDDETSSSNVKEEIVLFSLQSMGKVIKSFIEENENINNNDNKKSQL